MRCQQSTAQGFPTNGFTMPCCIKPAGLQVVFRAENGPDLLPLLIKKKGALCLDGKLGGTKESIEQRAHSFSANQISSWLWEQGLNSTFAMLLREFSAQPAVVLPGQTKRMAPLRFTPCGGTAELFQPSMKLEVPKVALGSAHGARISPWTCCSFLLPSCLIASWAAPMRKKLVGPHFLNHAWQRSRHSYPQDKYKTATHQFHQGTFARGLLLGRSGRATKAKVPLSTKNMWKAESPDAQQHAAETSWDKLNSKQQSRGQLKSTLNMSCILCECECECEWDGMGCDWMWCDETYCTNHKPTMLLYDHWICRCSALQPAWNKSWPDS